MFYIDIQSKQGIIVPIPINNNLSYAVSKAVQCIENPNKPWGVLIEEIPSDLGRTYQSYKRGGILEGAERFRRETLSAAVWLFGIPIFNWIGNKFFENVLHVPMNMDYSDETIKDTVTFLKKGENPKNLKISELSDYAFKKIKDGSIDDVVKSVKKCKGISIISATILNCVMMGIVIPKYNQYLTKKKLQKQKVKQTVLKAPSFDEFKNKTSNKQPSFTGNLVKSISDFIVNYPYLAENNNRVRLISTDIPTLIGRASTSRNKYEALENTIVDGGSIYFYNFCAQHLKKLLCSKTNIPIINPMTYSVFANADENTIASAIEKVKNANKKINVDEIFDKEFANKIYDYSTFGKYTKLNRYVTPESKEEIDKQVYKYLKTISKKMTKSANGSINIGQFRELTKKYNLKSAGFLGIGFAVAIYGLSTFLPKLAFKITTLLTGKNEFTGIAHFDDEKDNVKKS